MNYTWINDIGVIKLIKLSYDSTLKHINARVTYERYDGKNEEHNVSNLDVINELLNKYTDQELKTIPDLISDRILFIADNRLYDGVVVIDSERKYHKFAFDSSKGQFTETRLSRMERNALGINSYDSKEELVSPVESDELEDKAVVVEHHDSIPEVEIKVDEPVVESEKEPSTVVVESPEPTIAALSDGSYEVSGTDVEEKTVAKEEKVLTKKSVKNLKINKKALAILGVAAALVLVGCIYGKQKSDDINKRKNDKSDDNPNPRYEQDINDQQIDTTFTQEEPTEVFINDDVYEDGKYASLGSIIASDDMFEQTQFINDVCFSYEPGYLHNLVVDTDKPTISVINEARNNALNNSYNRDILINLLDQYTNYIFEGTTLFDGTAVKAYDYLTPYAKYIVIVSAQSMLQLYPDYNYSTTNNIYVFEDLVELLDNQIDPIYRELTGLGRAR